MEDEQILAQRMEVRSNRPNGSGMNKIVRSWSATRYSMRSRLRVQITIAATTWLAAFGSGQPAFAEEEITEPRCACGLSTGADLLSAGLRTLPDPAKTHANEGDSRIDGHARAPQTLSRHRRRSSAVDPRSTASVVITHTRTPWS